MTKLYERVKGFLDPVKLVFVVLFVPALQVASVARTSARFTSSTSITFAPAPLTFGNVAVGGSGVRSEVAKNLGRKNIVLTRVTIRGSSFSIKAHPRLPYTLSAGASVPFKVKFGPQAADFVSGRITLYYKYTSNGSWRSASRAVRVSGTGASPSSSLVASSTALSFGKIQISNTETLSETVANSGSTAVTILQITASGAGFWFSGINPPVTLSSGQRATFYVSFRPQTSGSVTGNLKISSNAPSPSLSVPLSGTGSTPGKMTVSPSSINFGSVTIGTKKSQRGTVSAVNGPVTVSAANVSGTEFRVSGLSFPFTLSAGHTASYTLTFAPTASGSTSSTVTWHSSASNSPVRQSLTGSGTHLVALTWRASTSRHIVGYNIYRGHRSGGPYTKINTALDPNTHDIDYKVLAGTTYYYVVTAVNSRGRESVYSNQVKSVIPYP